MFKPKDILGMDNLLIYGAGGAARDLISLSHIPSDSFELASSHGGEVLNEKLAKAISSIEENKRYNIVIASQYFHEIYTKITQCNIQFYNIYCFNVYTTEISPIEDVLRCKEKRTLYAVYDLEQNPASFDACVFANAAEIYRIENDFDDICFLVVPPILKYGRLCDANFYNNGDEKAFKSRIDALLMPIFTLIPSHASTLNFNSRDDARIFIQNKQCFPTQYRIENPVDTHNPIEMFQLPSPVGFF